jgi:hypothetical protein
VRVAYVLLLWLLHLLLLLHTLLLQLLLLHACKELAFTADSSQDQYALHGPAPVAASG